jgi:hypothetical protein
MDMSRREDITQVSDEENTILTENFMENEVRPDGFPAEFYQTF